MEMTDTSSAVRRYQPHEQTLDTPNIVVDGSPNAATVLTLTHWPGIAQPPQTNVDTSAEMAFGYMDDPVDHAPASVVTNNHFDQDGAAGILALIEPAAADHRELLIDLAHAGDFGTYRLRNAARASMILHGFADPHRSPIKDQLGTSDDADAAALYRAVLPELLEIATNPSKYQQLWAAEDEALSASEAMLADGRAHLLEDPDIDLAIVELDDGEEPLQGHRFGHIQLGPLHPMAVHNATQRSRLLLIHRNQFIYVDRYETWVQLHSRRPLPRVDMRPLAQTLSSNESGATTWLASAPSGLTPTLRTSDNSSLSTDQVLAAVRSHLRDAPPAWDPYTS